MKRLILRLMGLEGDSAAAGPSGGGLKALLRDPLYSNALYLMLCSIANALAGFIFWIIAARFYSAGDVGVATAVISAATLLSGLSSMGFGYGMIRFLKSSAEPCELINSGFTTAGVISVAAALVFLLGLGLWSPKLVFIRERAGLFALFVLIIPAVTISGLTDQVFVAGRRAGFVLARNLIFNVSRPALLIALAVSFHAFGIFASWGLATFLALLAGVLVFLPRARSDYSPAFAFDRRALTDILHFSFMNYLADILGAAPVYILPILVLNILGAESNAYYYIAWSIGGMLSMIPAAITTSLFAEGSHKEEGLSHNTLRSLKMIFFLLIPAVITMLALTDRLLLLFGGLYSRNAATLLRLTIASSIPGAVNAVYFNIKRVQKKLGVMIGMTVFSGAAAIILSYILLPYAGIAGAGIAWLAAQSCVALAVVVGWLMKMRRD